MNATVPTTFKDNYGPKLSLFLGRAVYDFQLWQLRMKAALREKQLVDALMEDSADQRIS